MIADWLRPMAAARPTPPDLAHLHNFDDPRRPYAITRMSIASSPSSSAPGSPRASRGSSRSESSRAEAQAGAGRSLRREDSALVNADTHAHRDGPERIAPPAWAHPRSARSALRITARSMTS
jgi:hypothetical protein